MSYELVRARRWERRRLLLRNLQLRYPTYSESQTLSKLARVDNRSRFSSHIQSIILDAHLNDKALRGFSMPMVRVALNKVMASCRELRHALSAIDVPADRQSAPDCCLKWSWPERPSKGK
jgi:hypothetical protein